jgi:hypothetical protein
MQAVQLSAQALTAADEAAMTTPDLHPEEVKKPSDRPSYGR